MGIDSNPGGVLLEHNGDTWTDWQDCHSNTTTVVVASAYHKAILLTFYAYCSISHLVLCLQVSGQTATLPSHVDHY